jgi:predicted RNA binding protein with dsRBD fold (UPF0201 family)
MTEQVQEQEVQLSLNDIAAAVQIIDVVTKRGAFEGAELEAVGMLRNRFAKFVEARAPKQEDGVEKVEAEAVEQ